MASIDPEHVKGKGANAPTLPSAIASLKGLVKTDISVCLGRKA